MVAVAAYLAVVYGNKDDLHRGDLTKIILYLTALSPHCGSPQRIYSNKCMTHCLVGPNRDTEYTVLVVSRAWIAYISYGLFS